MKTIILVSGAITVAVLLSGCGKQAALGERDLVGHYTINYSYGGEGLTLASDGTFMQFYTNYSSGKVNTNHGTWRFFTDPCSLHLRDVIIYDSGYGEQRLPPIRSDWSLNVHLSFGRTKLPISESGAWAFTKQD